MRKTSKIQWQSGFRQFAIICVCLMFITTAWAETSPGDIDGNQRVDLGDSIRGLQVLSESENAASSEADISGDHKIGIEEVIYVLRYVAGLPVMTSEQKLLKDTANFTVLALDDGEKSVENLEQINTVLGYLGLDNAGKRKRSSILDAVSSLSETSFSCGEVTLEAPATVVFAFNDGSDCSGITGTVKITPYLSSGAISYTIDYEDITIHYEDGIKEDCTISGSTSSHIATESGQVNASHTFDNMSICGQHLDGEVNLTYNADGQVLSLEREAENTYSVSGTEASVTTAFSYTSTDGLTGTATVIIEEQTYEAEFAGIQADAICGVPTAGTMTVSGTQLDFSNTSCSNPAVAVTMNGITFDVNLEDAKNVFQAPLRARASLRSVDRCETLLDEFKQAAIADMEERLTENLNYAIQWGGCGGAWKYGMLDDADYAGGVAPVYATEEASSSSAPEESASEYSETNTQVVGVDEADFVKNDGSYIYILADDKFRIIDAWPPEDSATVSVFAIEGTPKKMFVHNQKAFVYSSLESVRQNTYDTYAPYYYETQDECTYGYNCEFTGDGRKLKITVLDISDVTAPALVRELYFSGSYLNSRRIREAVHSAVIFPEPFIDGIEYWPEELQNCWGYWDYYYYWWEDDQSEEYTEEELREMFESLKQRNEALILASNITDWLPSVRDIRHADGQTQETQGLLGDCSDYYVTLQKNGKNFLSMVSLDVGGTGDINSTTIVGKPGAVYASSSAFYICSKHEHAPQIYWFFDPREEIEEASTVHKFTLTSDPPASAYKGSGAVKGSVLNQFSMDEYQGYFRIATTSGHVPNPNVHSTLSVLEDTGTELVVAGQIDGIAPTEDIRSARFDGDRGYVVTFKKTDPLFVFDLSDPKNPVTAGELKIPGFSTYIHPMDDTHLLSIGYDSEEADSGSFAWFQGIMLQLFDVSDMSDPKLTHKEVIGTRGTTSDAATNHLAFNFFRPKELLAIPMVICEGGSGGGSYGDTMTFSGLMVYKVTTDEGFDYLGGVSHGEVVTGDSEYSWRSPCANWWTESNSQVKRSIFMDDYVFSITEDEIKVDKVSELGKDVAVLELTDD